MWTLLEKFLRGMILDRQGLEDIDQFRIIVNYDIPVF